LSECKELKNKNLQPPPVETREEFLTARQLAAILQVSEATVRRLARKGRIPSIRLTPRITRFHLQAVRDALDGRPRSRRSTTEAEAENPQLSFTDLL
jgi:excisionase family DNA binding protein